MKYYQLNNKLKHQAEGNHKNNQTQLSNKSKSQEAFHTNLFLSFSNYEMDHEGMEFIYEMGSEENKKELMTMATGVHFPSQPNMQESNPSA